MASLNPSKVAAAGAATTDKPAPVTLAGVLSAAVAEKPKKPFMHTRKGLMQDPGLVRAYHVISVPPDVEYAEAIAPQAFRAAAVDLRPGDLIELRAEPNLRFWALLLVGMPCGSGVMVRELVYRTWDDAPPAASIEELAGLVATQTAINSWQLVRADGHVLPEVYRSPEEARSAIHTLAPKFQGRGWSKG